MTASFRWAFGAIIGLLGLWISYRVYADAREERTTKTITDRLDTAIAMHDTGMREMKGALDEHSGLLEETRVTLAELSKDLQILDVTLRAATGEQYALLRERVLQLENQAKALEARVAALERAP